MMIVSALGLAALTYASSLVQVGTLTAPNGDTIPVYADASAERTAPFKWPEPSELDLMTRTLWGEARSQSDEEIAWIAHTVVNRVESWQFPNSFEKVLLQANQFSVWNAGDPNREKMVRLRREDPAYQRVFSIVLSVVSDRYLDGPDPTHGANHYHHGDAPYWAEAALWRLPMGDATFYHLRR
jgi:N-acetylmuramoyl-L-alanine amidase